MRGAVDRPLEPGELGVPARRPPSPDQIAGVVLRRCSGAGDAAYRRSRFSRMRMLSVMGVPSNP